MKSLLAAVAMAGLVAFAGTARAHSILAAAGSPVITGTGPYTWTYNETVTNDADVQSGDYFVIVDFAGLVSGSNFQPAGWTFSTIPVVGTITGTDGTSLTPTDSSGVVDLKWTYSGAQIGGAGVSVPLGAFGAQSTFNTQVSGVQVALDHNYNPGNVTDNKTDVNSQAVAVPAGSVPLPATASTGLALLVGLGGLMGLRRLASRRAAA